MTIGGVMVSLYLRILHWILMHLASRGRVHVAMWLVALGSLVRLGKRLGKSMQTT
jgi:hypothetical protein